MRALSLLWLVACGGGPGPAPSDADPPAPSGAASYRLTPRQLRNALHSLLPHVPRDLLDRVGTPWVAGPAVFERDPGLRPVTEADVADAMVLADVVAIAAADWPPLAACADWTTPDAPCTRGLLTDLATRAWRRPLTPDDTADLDAALDDLRDASDPWLGTLGALQLVVLDPAFQYRIERGREPVVGDRRPLTSHEVAARLALALWDDLPDDALRAAADADGLTTPDAVRAQADRMLTDPRARPVLERFYEAWLDLGGLRDHTPDPAVYFPDLPAPHLDRAQEAEEVGTLDGLVAEVRLLGASVTLDRSGTLDELLTTSDVWVSDRSLARVYGAEADTTAPWSSDVVERPFDLYFQVYSNRLTAVTLDPARRAGVLTLGGPLAATSGTVHPSPVHRGTLVLERLLCDPPDPPPAGITPVAADSGTGATNRERYAAHVAEPACASCHTAIDGIGFTFEHYDALGRWREQDGGLPVDATGALTGTREDDGPLVDAVHLAHVLAGSRQVHDCHADWWARYVLGDVDSASPAARDALREGFWAEGGHVPTLLRALVTSEAFLTLPAEAP